jgi:hypothetical protein
MIPEQAAPGHTLQAASMPDSRRMPPVELMEVSENMSQRQAQQGMPISTLNSADTRQDTLPATGTVEICHNLNKFTISLNFFFHHKISNSKAKLNFHSFNDKIGNWPRVQMPFKPPPSFFSSWQVSPETCNFLQN